jgi:hypothetical protein
MIYKKDELYFIVWGWMKTPLEDNVYTDREEAETICLQKNMNNPRIDYCFEVMSVDEYIDYMYEIGASGMRFSNKLTGNRPLGNNQ